MEPQAQQAQSPAILEIDPAARRVLSIDALRGFDMFWIVGGGAIFANLHPIFQHPATEWIKTQLTHVPWEGFRFEDLIMPLFLFIVGVVMPFSFSRRLVRGDRKARLHAHVLIRVVVLWILGMIKQGNLLEFDLSSLRLYSNTLQAIAAGYLIAALVVLNLPLFGQILLWLLLLVGYWALLMFVPVPSFGPGVLTEQGNLAMYIDKLLLGRFQDGTSYTWILSSMTFAATVMMGIFAGKWLRGTRSDGVKAFGLILAGAACIGAGLAWSQVFPIIKHIWTSSFVLFSGGICLALLGLFYLVIDVWGLQKWSYFFVVLGANAIFVYMSTSLIHYRWTADKLVGGLDRWMGPWTELVHVTVAFGLTWLLLFWMYRKKTFIRI
ncbi:MAG: DUF5009 domain-containing protein [Sedimentisphaerales bacterium]|nr:DUF5009 domain-containing protein [Sedimentisphaerales bacterium]